MWPKSRPRCGGQVWGSLSASTAGEPLKSEAERRLIQLADLAGAAIANAENRLKLTASRARVIASADDARRRLQRDVHDGAQQRLVHTIIAVNLARTALLDGRAAADLLDEALRHARSAAEDLRTTVAGILPAALVRGGLRSSLEALIDDIAGPVKLRTAEVRPPAAVETIAYFVIAELLTNVVKHAQATRAEVEVDVTDERVRLVVRDDGIGRADPGGTGLIGLADRVDAAGGKLHLSSTPDDGTVVTVVLLQGP